MSWSGTGLGEGERGPAWIETADETLAIGGAESAERRNEDAGWRVGEPRAIGETENSPAVGHACDRDE